MRPPIDQAAPSDTAEAAFSLGCFRGPDALFDAMDERLEASPVTEMIEAVSFFRAEAYHQKHKLRRLVEQRHE